MLRILGKSLKSGLVTSAYPQASDSPAAGFRGLPEWLPVNCDRCGRCASQCPTQAITLGAVDRYWSIDARRCLFCGYCEDACTHQALRLGLQYELAEKVTPGKNGFPEKFRNKLQTGSGEQHSFGQEGQGRAEPEIANEGIFGRSVHIRHLDAGSCNGCDWEMVNLTGPVYDIQRLGFDFVASPRHADLLMVTGPVTRNLEIAVRRTFAATPAPKLVVAAGTCACSGGICGRSYASAGGVDNILPVEVYIPGCPPRPQALIDGLLKAVHRR